MPDNLNDVVELLLASTTARASRSGSCESTSGAEDAITDENNTPGEIGRLTPTLPTQEGRPLTEVGAEVAPSPNPNKLSA
jgi:hypothetical protein